MKLISVSVSDAFAKRVKAVAKDQEMSVGELLKQSLETYVSRLPAKPRRLGKLPVFKLGKPRQKDLRKAIYQDSHVVSP